MNALDVLALLAAYALFACGVLALFAINPREERDE